MANGDADARAMMDNARRQNFEFMQQARAQMQNQLEVQRMHIAHASGPAGAAAGSSQPQPGTPAGRLLETITSLIQRGASMAAAPMVAGVGGVMAGAGAAGQVAGGAASFYMSGGNTPFGIGGISGGMESINAQRNMGFYQNLFTAYGRGLPFGQYAAQRVDMTARQAETMAREELGSRLRQGAWSGVTAGLNAVTLGSFGYAARVMGIDITVLKREQMARDLQQQMRFVTRGALAAGGMGGAAGEFSTGISRAGALEIGNEMNVGLARMQQEMGLSAREVVTLRGRAMGTMTRGGIEKAVAKGPGALDFEVQRQTEAVRDIQQMLNVTEDIAPRFWDMVRKMGTVATEIKKSAQQAVGLASRTGLGQLEVMEALAEARSTGIQMGMGGARGERVTSQYMENRYQTYKGGGISKEGMMFYGGETPEAGLRIQAQMQIQRNVGIWQGGGLGGLDLLATGGRENQAAWSTAMGGGMNYVQMAGAVGGALARNPLARLEARYSPETQEMMSGQALRAAFIRAEKVPILPFGGDKGAQLQRMEAFRKMTGLTPEQARLEYNAKAAEQGMFMRAAGDNKAVAAGMWSIYSTLQGQGAAEAAMKITKTSDTYAAATKLYEQATMGGKEYDPSVDILDALGAYRADMGAADALRSLEKMGGVAKSTVDVLSWGPSANRLPLRGGGRGINSKDPLSGGGSIVRKEGRLFLSSGGQDTELTSEMVGRMTPEDIKILRGRLISEDAKSIEEAEKNLGVRGELVFSRNRRVSETLFSGEAEDFGEFAKRLAQADVSGSTTARTNLGKYGMTELSAWSKLYEFGSGGFALQDKDKDVRGALSTMFGAKSTSIVSGILNRAQTGESEVFSAEEIGSILEAGPKGGAKFGQVMALFNKAGVAHEILQRTLQLSDSTKTLPIPGANPDAPMWVAPSVGGQKRSWAQIALGAISAAVGSVKDATTGSGV